MNLLANMAVVIEKELELENQGVPRTRRFIGDDPRVGDDRWYQRRAIRVVELGHDLTEDSQVAVAKTRRKVYPSILSRLFRRPRVGPKMTCEEVCTPEAVRS